MNFCINHFGKSLDELVYEDIENFFKIEREETDQLEFKSINPNGDYGSKLKGINRTVCAFLNSSGGLLIWGAPKEKQATGKKGSFAVGELTFFESEEKKDTLISKISDSITPLPSGIRIRVITKESKYLYIIEVDRSEYSPHQTSDIFYMRIDGQSRPAPHHYIEALFKKVKYPDIEAYIKITDKKIVHYISNSYYKVSFRFFAVNFSPLQNEEALSFRIISNGVFESADDLALNGHEYRSNNAKAVLHYGEPYTKLFTIVFNPLNLKDHQGFIMISLGGKKSPHKQSHYDIDFRNFIDSETKDFNSFLIAKFENKLSKDIADEKGNTKEKIVEFLLNNF